MRWQDGGRSYKYDLTREITSRDVSFTVGGHLAGEADDGAGAHEARGSDGDSKDGELERETHGVF